VYVRRARENLLVTKMDDLVEVLSAGKHLSKRKAVLRVEELVGQDESRAPVLVSRPRHRSRNNVDVVVSLACSPIGVPVVIDFLGCVSFIDLDADVGGFSTTASNRQPQISLALRPPVETLMPVGSSSVRQRELAVVG